ncbi:hypothetical protein JP75_07695 [Devosia riboflavina]|uniref:Uncharacterized protein n=1 Tax=Devosia riboflavina TaxID=46914 RepID=A0A087M3H7_9HYPH|nr:hypothetical protein [Devosia riboflavina]KFL31430.1 hypothetical protein JP75_07695 [Devosia riboflavina]
MTLFPQHTQRDIRNLATASLSMIAYFYQCEVSDVLGTLITQPTSHAPAAAAPVPPADATAEDDALSSSADQSQAKAADDATSGSAMSEPSAPAGGPQEAEAVSRVGGDRAPSATSEGMDVTAGETAPNSPETAPSGEERETGSAAGESPVIRAAGDTGAQPAGGENVAPKKSRRTKNLDAALAGGTRTGGTTSSAVGSGALTDFDKAVLALHTADPQLTRREIAARLGKSVHYTSASVRKQKLPVMTGRAGDVVPEPPIDISKLQRAQPKKPGPIDGFTLKYRVQKIHEQHPNLTASLIAKQLGAKVSSVSTYLVQFRTAPGVEVTDESMAQAARVLPNGVAGEVEARMRSDAQARKARLGKTS